MIDGDLCEIRHARYLAAKKVLIGAGFTEIIANDITYQCINKNFDKPYHNAQHMMAVTIRCNELIETLAPDSDVNKQAVLFSAMFHDFNHTAGYLNDDVNICFACHAAVSYIQENFDTMFETHTMSIRDFINEVVSIISCTRFPFRKSDAPETINQQIIRDADLTMCLEPDAEIFAAGLSEEMKKLQPSRDFNLSVSDMLLFLSVTRNFLTIHKKSFGNWLKIGECYL